MKTISKIVLAVCFTVGLAACDDKSTTDNNTETQTVANTSANDITLLDGKLKFAIPGYLKDQSGLLEKQTNDMLVYADEMTQQVFTIFLSDAEGSNAEVLIEALSQQYQARDNSSQVLEKKALDLPVPAWRLDLTSRIQGKNMYNCFVMMVIDQRLVTIQFSMPNEAQNKPAEMAETFIKSIHVQA